MNPKPGTVKQEWPIKKATPRASSPSPFAPFRRRGRVAQESSLAPSLPFLYVPLKDPDRRCPSETRVGTALTAGRLASGGGP